MTATATVVYPVIRRFIGVAKEATPGTAVMPTATMPMKTFDPVDKITYIEDDAWRNAMAGLYNLIQGVRESEISMGGPMFADGIGYAFLNTLGDYWQSVNGTIGTTTTLSTGSALGAASVVVASATGITTSTIIALGTLGTTAEEVRKVTNVSGGTLTLNSGLYQAHPTGAPVTAYSSTSTFVHNFSLLNSGTGAGGYSQAQPPTFTFMDYTGVPASTGARQYAFSCMNEMSITGIPNALVEWDAKTMGWASGISGTAPTASITAVAPQPAWNSTVSIAGTQVTNNVEWKLTLTRQEEVIYTNSGQQDPFSIPRGALTASLGLNFHPAQDESEFLYYLNNTQPTLSIVASNGLTGASAASLTVNIQVDAFDTGKISDQKTVFGFDETAKAVANTTNAGPSGGYSPVQIALQNAVVNY